MNPKQPRRNGTKPVSSVRIRIGPLPLWEKSQRTLPLRIAWGVALPQSTHFFICRTIVG